MADRLTELRDWNRELADDDGTTAQPFARNADAIDALIEAREAIVHLNALRTWSSETDAGRKARASLEIEAERLSALAIARIDALGEK